MNTLQVNNLTKIYPNGVKALNGVSLSISNGMFGLLGANGAGKSTLMRTIATLQAPSEGSVIFNKTDIVKHPDVLRSSLGYLPQEFGVYPKVSAEELLNHIAVLKGLLDKKFRQEQVEALLVQTNLYDQRKKNVYTFSGGMRQRFGIAQALLGNPKIIIVDEPTAGLDPEERNRFLNLLSEIGENIIVVLSTHIVTDIHDLCSDMAILNQGEILVTGKPQELVSTLVGKVWSKVVAKKDVAEYKSQFNVISTRLIGGNIQITIMSESKPGDDFQIKNPTLEDFYFYSSSKVSHSKAVVS